MEVTQPLRVGLGLAVGLNPQYSHPVCMTTKTSAFMQQSMIPRDSLECWEEVFHEHGRTVYGKFLDGNRQGTDVLNESVTQ